jgi:hypothetical protein
MSKKNSLSKMTNLFIFSKKSFMQTIELSLCTFINKKLTLGFKISLNLGCKKKIKKFTN